MAAKLLGSNLFNEFVKRMNFDQYGDIEQIGAITVDVVNDRANFEKLRNALIEFFTSSKISNYFEKRLNYKFDNPSRILDFMKSFVEYNNILNSQVLLNFEFARILKELKKLETPVIPNEDFCLLTGTSRTEFTLREIFDIVLFEAKHYTIKYHFNDYAEYPKVMLDLTAKETGYYGYLLDSRIEYAILIDVISAIDKNFMSLDKKHYRTKISKRDVLELLNSVGSKTVDLIELYQNCRNAWEVMYGMIKYSNSERLFHSAFFSLLYRLANKHFYANLEMKNKFPHLLERM